MSKVWIRADGGAGIGAGHLMRCLSIAQAIGKRGSEAAFLVSSLESVGLVARSGVECILVPGDFSALGSVDACEILERTMPDDIVLVDSYAVSEEFFDPLVDGGLRVAYIDDRYLFSAGALGCPRRWNVDILIDYGFGAKACGYGSIYLGSRTRLLLGPRYAPVRRNFREARTRRSCNHGCRVLVTCGSTNPGHALERMTEGCLMGCNLPVDVVVGEHSDFDGHAFSSDRVCVHRGVRDLAPFMARAALAVSAAGFTLYELSCVGVPSVACPIVENQNSNVNAFAELRLGISLQTNWTAEDVRDAISSMDGDPAVVGRFNKEMLSAVDGDGSQRIANALTLEGMLLNRA